MNPLWNPLSAGTVRAARGRCPASASLAALAVLNVSLLVTPAPAGGTTPEEDAFALLRRGDYEEAQEALASLLAKEPDNAAARRAYAEALAAVGRYEEALKALEGEPASRNGDLLAARGRILLRIGRLKEAEEAFRKALELDPEDVEAWNRLGEVLWKTGRRREAETAWRRIIGIYQAMSVEEAESLPARDFVEMGLALVGLNRFRDANDVMFPQAEEIDPKNPELLLEWGRILMAKYNYPQSRECLREALDVNPRFADAMVAMAENYLLDFQVGTKRYELAEKNLERALEVNPRHAEAYRTRGHLWLTDGNLPRAEADLGKALEIDPADLRARGLLAAVYHLAAREEDFRREEARALEINPRAAEFYHTIAQAIEVRFRYDDAVAMCDRALELDPDYWPAYHTLAINCLRTGDEKRGRDYLERSWEKDPFNVWVLNTRRLLRYMDRNHREYRAEHFVCKFPKTDYDVLESFLVPLLEEAYRRIPPRYGVELEPPIYIEVFSTHKWFSARIVGLEGFPATGACFGRVVALTTPKALPQNWGAVAWHEFAHVVTLAATGHRIPRWLTEGISVYEEGLDHPGWRRNFEREIADHFASGRLLPIGELDYGFTKPKYPGQVLISYYQGCLVVEYIKERWGFEKVVEILGGYKANKPTPKVFKDVLGIDLGEFDKGFHSYLERWVEATGYQPRLFEEVVPRLEIAVEEKPRDVKLLLDLAWAYYSNGNEIDAPLTAGKVLAIEPENPDALAILGFSELDAGKTASAKEKLTKALEKGTRFRFRAHAALARIARKEGDRSAAIRHLEEARRISPRAGAATPPRGNVYYQLWDLYNEAGESEKAVEALETLRSIAGEDGYVRELLLKHYLAREDEASAVRAAEILEEMIFINPFDRRLHERLAQAAVRLGRHETVIREYRYLLKFPDTNPRVAYTALAKAHLALGQKNEAREYARKLLDLDPENEEAKKLLAEIEK